MRSSTSDLLFALLRSALWGQQTAGGTLSAGEYARLTRMADAQTVGGLVGHALIHDGWRLQRMDAIVAYHRQQETALLNTHLEHSLIALAQMLGRHDTPFRLVKGPLLAALYQQPKCREVGDIDIYVPPDHYAQSLHTIEREWQVSPDTGEEAETGHATLVYGDDIFEIHHTLSRFASRRHSRTFSRWIEGDSGSTALIGGHSIPILSPELNLIYTLSHLWGHLMELGVGLRQLCDMAMLLAQWHALTAQAADGAERTRRLVSRLGEIGLAAPLRAIETLLTGPLGMSPRFLLIPTTARDQRRGERILRIVMERGNFGMPGRHNAPRSGMAYYVETMRVKLTLYARLFPLSPRETTAALLQRLPHKVMRVLRGN